MPVNPGSLSGYIDYTEELQYTVGSLIGYIEWVGTPDPIVPAEDSLIGDLIGYVEYRFGSDPGGPVVILSGDYQVIWLL
jgi:hypothetical protein